jgi:hypothetical protein
LFAALSEHDIAPRTAAARGGTVEPEGFTPDGVVGIKLWKTPRVEREEHR